MNVLVNSATLRGLGSSGVGQNLLRAFVQAEGGHAFDLWIPSEWGSPRVFEAGHVRVHEVAAGARSKFLAENVGMRRSIARWPAQCVFSLGDTSLPACPVPHLILVQLPYLAYGPADRDFPMPAGFRAKIALIEGYFRACLPSVSAFTVQTHHMKRKLVERWDLAEDRVYVVPSAIEPVQVDALTHGVPRFIAYPASPSAHKNHVILADLMASLRRSGHRVPCRVTVNPSDVPALVYRARMLGVLDDFEFVGRVSLLESRRMMQEAAVVVIPSKLETFGLPYFEAMSVASVIVAADRECAREACGDAALYADPDSGEALGAAVGRALSDATLARSLSDKAVARFKTLDVGWDSVAAAYLQILERIQARGRTR